MADAADKVQGNEELEQKIFVDELCFDNQNHFEAIIRDTDAGYFFIDRNGFIRQVNKAWLKLYRYDFCEEVIGKHFSVVQKLDDREQATKYVEEIMKGNESYLKGIFSRRCKDESTGYHAFTARPVYSDTQVTGIEGFILDITEKQLNEEALRVTERRFRKAEIIAGLGYWEYHTDKGVMMASKGTSSIYGLEGSEWPLAEVQKYPLPQYRKMLDEKLFRLMQYNEPYNAEFQVCRATDGSILWVRSIAEYDTGQKVVYGVLHDITAEKEKEAALNKTEHDYKSLFTEMIDAFSLHRIICDEGGRPADYRFLSVNPSFERMTGLKATDIIGKKVTEVLPGIEKVWIETYGRVALTGESVRFENYSQDLKRLYEVNAYRTASCEFAAVFTDITEKRKAEDALKSLNESLEIQVRERTKLLEAAVRELEGFSYSVSHDLRAPLRHMTGFVEMLNKRLPENLDEKSRHYLSVISDAANQMGHLIDDLLSFSRMGKAEMRKSAVDMNKLVREAIKTLKPDTEERMIEWHIEKLPDAEGDYNMLSTVLSNLIHNALKFSRPKPYTRIEIGSGTDDIDSGNVVYYVKDNGVGFDMRYKDKLFTIFQRLHKHEEFEGTGVGLASVQRIILRHGGRAWAESTLYEGATFYFTLPEYKGERT